MGSICNQLSRLGDRICSSPRLVCASLATTSQTICDATRTLTQEICDATQTLTQTICDATQTFTQTVCDATQTVTQTICDASTTVTNNVCSSWGTIPIIGGLVCLFSHVVSTVVCTVSHIVSTVVCTVSHIVSTVVCTVSHIVSTVICVASHIVSTAICIASHVVTTSICLAWTLVGAVGCVVVGGAGRVICSFVPSGVEQVAPAMLPGNNYVRNFVDGAIVLEHLKADLETASNTINISMFLFFNDPIGQEIADILIRKASNRDRSVKVRVLTNFNKTKLGDPFSTGEKGMMDDDPNFHENPLDIDALAKKMRAGGVEVLNTDIDYDKIVPTTNAGYASDAALIRRATNIDAGHVDHRKIVTIDGMIGYCGSANIGAQYMYHIPFDPRVPSKNEVKQILAVNGPEPWLKWHDGLARFEGPVVNVFDEVFKERWVLDGGQDFQIVPPNYTNTAPGVKSLQVIPGTPGFVNGILNTYKRMIATAKSSIFIENAYMFHPEIVQALLDAKKKNPDLRITLVLPNRDYNDNPLDQDAQEYRYQLYVPAGIELYEYQNHFNHLKIATFDDQSSILGSANLNYRSLQWDKDFEMVVLVEDENVAGDINANVRDVDITHSRRITAADLTLVTNTRNPATWVLEQAAEI